MAKLFVEEGATSSSRAVAKKELDEAAKVIGDNLTGL